MPADEERMYGSRSYWDTRYSKDAGEPFEWLQSYEHIQGLINEQFSNKSGKVLYVGCGRSNLCKDMSRDGYANIEGVDWCQVLIDRCNAENPSIPHTACSVLDLESKFGENSIDYIVDKALLDSILCGANSTQNAYTYLMQVKKVLKPGGKCIIISYGQPAKRRNHLDRPQSLNFTIQEKALDKPQAAGVTPQGAGIDPQHFAYILTK